MAEGQRDWGSQQLRRVGGGVGGCRAACVPPPPPGDWDWCYAIMEGDEVVFWLECGYDPGACEPTVDGTACVDLTGGGGGGSGGDSTDPPPEEELVRPDGVEQEFWDRITDSEKRYCIDHPVECVSIAYGTAELLTDPFGTYYHDLLANETNAVRHCIWSAWLHALLGAESAWGWLNIHEAESEDPVDTEIDMNNNQRGEELWQQVGPQSRVGYATYCRTMLYDGYLDTGENG